MTSVTPVKGGERGEEMCLGNPRRFLVHARPSCRNFFLYSYQDVLDFSRGGARTGGKC